MFNRGITTFRLVLAGSVCRAVYDKIDMPLVETLRFRIWVKIQDQMNLENALYQEMRAYE